MRRTLMVVLLCLFGLIGCKGCSDSGAGTVSPNNGTNNGETPEADAGAEVGVAGDACVDEDGDGFGVGLLCEGRVDCDDSNAAIHPDAEEACYDDIDNDCDQTIDEGCPDCDEGATRECGMAVGGCELGTQTCTDGVWSDCDGNVSPAPEACNGIDDDCDGTVDENPILLCDDGLMCNGSETCEAGACVSDGALDCTGLDSACTTGVCSEKDGGCVAAPAENGSPCDDGNFCTTAGTCNAGACESSPRDCSAEDDQCNVGVCDEAADACVKQPISDGTTCDDGAFCTTGDVCTAGSCGGATRDCSAAADQCNSGICDEVSDACAPMPLVDGTTCEDGEYCTVGDACQAGACASGGPRQCGSAGGSCREGVCDEVLDTCDGDPVPDGTSCDDGEFCTTGDACVAGACVGPTPRDCSSADAVCREGACNEMINQCVPVPVPDGQSCDDGAFCTVSDSCTAGTCSGTSRDCSAAADACNTGVCSETTDACVPQPRSDGTSCPDSLFCTVGEVCMTGSCQTTPRDCSGAGDQCNTGACDDTTDACIPQPVADGTTCDDGAFCTSADACTGGACGGTDTDCSMFDEQCKVGICSETDDECSAVAVMDGTTCDDADACTITDQCGGGTCGGTAVDCSMLDDACNVGVCDPNTGGCVAQPRMDGTTCNDGSLCTTADQCLGGVCTGTDVDCSGTDDQCNRGVCDPSDGSCQPDPVTNGTSCDDGAACTTSDACTDGICAGVTRDCSAFDAACATGECNPTNGTCFAAPRADGTSCDDGSLCTDGDQCSAGTCMGSTKDCSAFDGQCASGACNPGDGSCYADTFDDGTGCNDGDSCTDSDQCTSGTCAGIAKDCSAFDGQCATGACNPTNGSCFAQTASDGTGCDDGDNCTDSDQCTSGTCAGAAKDCSAFDGQCATGECNPTNGSCFSDPVSDGTVCDDGDVCTVNTTCQTGSCQGSPRDCSPVEDQCNDSQCVPGDGCRKVPLSSVPCDDGLWCTIDDECQSGACIAGPDRVCTPTTEPTACYDSTCTENMGGMCVDTDNGTCNVCDTATPTANAGGDQFTTPDSNVNLDASGSTDPGSLPLSYSWTLTTPSGSGASLDDPTSENPTFLADVSGAFVACVTVTNTLGCESNTDCMTVDVAPVGVDLHIELVWFEKGTDTISGTSDLDLHYQAPTYSSTRWFTGNPTTRNSPVAYWRVPSPNWGGSPVDQPDGSAANDPSLDVDNGDSNSSSSGVGPENINQSNLFDANGFTVGVGFYANYGPNTPGAPNAPGSFTNEVDARVRVFESGTMVWQSPRTTLECADFWEPATINVTGGGTNVNVSAKGTVTRRVTNSFCRCESNSDCFSGGTCTLVNIGGPPGPPAFVNLCR